MITKGSILPACTPCTGTDSCTAAEDVRLNPRKELRSREWTEPHVLLLVQEGSVLDFRFRFTA